MRALVDDWAWIKLVIVVVVAVLLRPQCIKNYARIACWKLLVSFYCGLFLIFSVRTSILYLLALIRILTTSHNHPLATDWYSSDICANVAQNLSASFAMSSLSSSAIYFRAEREEWATRNPKGPPFAHKILDRMMIVCHINNFISHRKTKKGLADAFYAVTNASSTDIRNVFSLVSAFGSCA